MKKSLHTFFRVIRFPLVIGFILDSSAKDGGGKLPQKWRTTPCLRNNGDPQNVTTKLKPTVI
jgi:hypothetical protein